MAGPTRQELEPGEAREIAAAARAGGGDPKRPPTDDRAFDAAAPGADRSQPKTHARRSGQISDATKRKVRKLARDGMARNEIARQCKISAGSVTTICRTAKPPISFDRSATAAAVEAKVIDHKARRADLAGKALDEVHRLFGLLTSPHEVIHWDKDGFVHRAEIERPTSGDVKNYATAIGILTDKHVALVKLDSDDRELPAVDRWLEAMGVA